MTKVFLKCCSPKNRKNGKKWKNGKIGHIGALKSMKLNSFYVSQFI